MNLKGKTILFICPKFFGYEEYIVSEMEKMGAEVLFLNDRPFDNPMQSALTKIFPRFGRFIGSRILQKGLNKNAKKNSFDILFVINGQTLSKVFLMQVRALNPKLRSILYLWDSIKNRKIIQRNFDFFDNIFTFDPEDARRYKLTFHPLFFKFSSEKQKMKKSGGDSHRIVFIGTMHSDRYKVIKAIKKNIPKDVKTNLYMFHKALWVYWFYKFTKKEYRKTTKNEFRFKPISQKEMLEVLTNSTIFLDVEHPLQTGLTIRTIEAMGLGKKIITTNASIRNYDFYDPNNIAIIDRHDTSPKIEMDFWRSQHVKIDEEIKNRYALKSWIMDIVTSPDKDNQLHET